MAKTKPIEIIKTYLGSGVLLTITGYITHWYFVGDVGWPVIVGFGVPAFSGGLGLALRLWQMTAPDDPLRRRGGRYVPIYANGKSGSLMLHSVSSIFQTQRRTQRQQLLDEFTFWENGMPAAIPESKLYSFCKTAYRRQRLVYFDAGELRSNQIFSRGYFTSEARPRYPVPDYDSIMYILASRNLVINRWQGKGGEFRYPPGLTVSEARARWPAPTRYVH